MSPSDWLPATIKDVRRDTVHARVLTLDVPGWQPNDPGQHLDVRLTAEDGYTAERSYSIASYTPGQDVELGIAVVADGEVSGYLGEVAEPGDALEVRGPLAHYFVWDVESPAPVQLIAGGSGIVPLLSMIRAHRSVDSQAPFRLLHSVRSPAEAMFRDEIEASASDLIDVTWTWTRSAPDEWDGQVGRLAAEDLAAASWQPDTGAVAFICGPTAFVEWAADALVTAGHDPRLIRTERFG